MKTKFTKGKWSISDIIEGNEYGVLSQQIDCPEAGVTSMIRIYHSSGLTEEDSANAKLIAAAPELFDACVYALKTFYTIGCTEDAEIVRVLEKVINKAND